jgi:hypothetical protein
VIRIKILSGPRAGESIELSEEEEAEGSIAPLIQLQLLRETGSTWELDFSESTEEEMQEWGFADVLVRAIRAFREGRPISFLGREYPAASFPDVAQGVLHIERLIRNGRYFVIVEQDDEKGLLIGMVDRPGRHPH